MRHLSIGMEALGDIPGTCTPLTLGAWLDYPRQEVVRGPLSLSRQYVSAVLRSAIHGCYRSGIHCACHRAIHALTTFLTSYAYHPLLVLYI